jgi:hypothetical protein
MCVAMIESEAEQAAQREPFIAAEIQRKRGSAPEAMRLAHVVQALGRPGCGSGWRNRTGEEAMAANQPKHSGDCAHAPHEAGIGSERRAEPRKTDGCIGLDKRAMTWSILVTCCFGRCTTKV